LLTFALLLQAAFCDDACVERYLKVRGNNCRRAARLLKATLNWREKINIGYLIADEFPTEIAAGAAYVAGFDDEGRPVLIIKKKPDHIVNHNQKPYLWYIIFTMEVAVAAMPPGVDQCVLILDAGGKLLVSCYTLQKSQAENIGFTVVKQDDDLTCV
jgi:hypothetical protein